MRLKRIFSILLVVFIIRVITIPVFADEVTSTPAKITHSVNATGSHTNWEGVCTVSEFADKNGQFAFAYEKSDRMVGLVFTKNGDITKAFEIKKEHPLFGAVTQDKSGFIYIVWGRTVTNSSEQAIFISKYTENGVLVKSFGAAQKGLYGDSGYNIKTPFEGGNCAVAINENVLAAFFSKKMINGHQGSAVFAIDLNTMRELDGYSFYESHSFAQRAIAYDEGFAFVSKGDCFNRGFVFGIADGSGKVNEMKTFAFWVDKNAYSNSEMSKLNKTYAELGDIAVTDEGNIALLGISAPSLSSSAKTEVGQLFIQIFNPSGDPTKSSTYITTGTRSGLAGNNGNESVTNYGVKWLTNSKTSYPYNAKMLSLSNGNLALLYEQYSVKEKKFEGSYYMVLSSSGEAVTKPTLVGTDIYLPKYEELVLDSNGDICFVGNKSGSDKLMIYRIDL
jgi:hypothetical protein